MIPPRLRAVALPAFLIWISTRALLLLATLPVGLNRWEFWDAFRYHEIIVSGYQARNLMSPSYDPLYPMLAHATALPWLIAGLLISNLALLVALVLVGLLSDEHAIAAMVIVAALPLSFFLSGVYADALFLALTAAVLYLARREMWLAASLPLAAAVVTRPFGMALCLAVWITYAAGRRYQLTEALALVGVPALAFVNWLLYLTLVYHDPLAVLRSEREMFGRAFRWPWETIWLQAQEMISAGWGLRLHMLLDLLPVLACLIILVVYARRWPLLYSLVTGLALLLCLISPVVSATGQYALISAGRYTLAIVPVLRVLGERLARLPRPVAVSLVVASLAFQLGLSIFVLHGGWIV